MALPNVPHQTGRVTSGDVTIFYRRFGNPGRTPMLVMHGANYFDSYDWIGVAGALAADPEVIAFDRRGWGESSWSPSKDYSLDAHVSDALTVAAHMGWQQAIFMGHSASARVVVSLVANFASKAAGLVVVGLSNRGPARKADLRTGDVVLEVGGAEVKDLAGLFRRIWSLGNAGVEVPMKIYRDGRTIELRVPSGDRNRFLKGPRLH